MTDRETILVIAGLTAFVVVIVFFLVRTFFGKSVKHMHKRLNGHDDASASGILVRRAKEKKKKGFFAKLDRSFEQMVQRTGLDLTTEEALGLIALLGMGLGAAFFLLRDEIWIVLLGLALGSGGTLGFFAFMQSRFRQQLQSQLPDAFYLMARSLRAGLSLDQAIELVGQHSTKPLAQEFAHCAAQFRLGLPVRTALEMTSERVQLTDFNAFVSTVMLYQTTGGNLAIQLDRLAESTRQRNQFLGFFRSATALARLSSLALGLAAPLMLLSYALFRPEHVIPFFQSATGWMAVGVALLLEVFGLFWVYTLTRVPS